MRRPGQWISLLPIVALVPRLGLVVLASDRQVIAPDARATLLWISSAALAMLVGLAELYIGLAVVSKRHAGLGALWVVLTVTLNALIVPLSVSGLEAVPVWQILNSRFLQVAWGAGLGLLSTVCVCGCLWADIVREGTGPLHLAAFQAQVQRSGSDACSASAALPHHSACAHCGFWDADQRKVAGHIRQCRRKASAQAALGAEPSVPSDLFGATPGVAPVPSQPQEEPADETR